MMRRTALIGYLTLAALAAGCSNAPAPAPPPDTRADDVKAVMAIEEAWSKDTAAKDFDKWMSYFADDATGLYPKVETLKGKEAIKAALAPYFADKNFALTFQSTKAVASKGGDMAYSLGTYTMTMTNPKTKKPLTDTGKYLTIYAKQSDGSWKVTVDTFNSDSPK